MPYSRPRYLTDTERACFAPQSEWAVVPGLVAPAAGAVSPGEQRALASLASAMEVPDAGPDGLPARLDVTAWALHAGKPNRNRFGFLAEDLERIAPTLAAPNLLPMDWNHGAMIPGRGPEAIGVWHRAEFAFDPQADEGRGLYGIQMHGTVWAWLFPEQARAMLASQARHGAAPFSVAVVGFQEVEVFDRRYGTYTVLVHPIPMTLSALDVTPADQDALGQATVSFGATPTGVAQALNHVFIAAGVTPAEEPSMTAEELKLLTETQEARAAADARVADLEATLAERTRDLETAQAALAEQETRVAELTSARDGLATQAAEAEARITELEAQAQRLAELEAEIAQAKAAEAAAALLASRREELPAEFLAAHDARDESVRTRVEARWAALDAEAWQQYRDEELLVGFTAVGGRQHYVARSKEAGRLAGGGAPEGDSLQSRARKLIKY